jgi:hypothetical protein
MKVKSEIVLIIFVYTNFLGEIYLLKKQGSYLNSLPVDLQVKLFKVNIKKDYRETYDKMLLNFLLFIKVLLDEEIKLFLYKKQIIKRTIKLYLRKKEVFFLFFDYILLF